MDKNKYIYIIGPEEKKLKEAVLSLVNLYSDTEFTKGISIFKSDKNEFVINFRNNPDFERFKYFVNYLHYPEVQSYEAKVFGYWTISDTDNIKQHLNKRALLYVSENDTEGDNVYALFEGGDKSAKLGFAIGDDYQELKEKEFEFGEPEIDESIFQLIERIDPTVTSKKESSSGCAGMVALILVFFVLVLSLQV
ncbi:hypothetical protein [Lunatibacter salilacus]|uniref:hypothetical protein n=1 Tax=Lunatibacter salilacus TaxID=2483804 RepID=UPI00131E9550|nr:hypothetical protein [Lunatibacter salilacus]